MYGQLLVAGVVTGASTVLFGFGGGFVVVPLLYSLLLADAGAHHAVTQAAMHIAVATSSAVMVASAGLATWRQQRAGVMDWQPVRPLLLYVAAGAGFGALLALSLRGPWLRWAFIAYLVLAIADNGLRRGFLDSQPGAELKSYRRWHNAAAGVLIGAIAALLGVGGSVLTVPLMRRRGASMAAATAMANPLSLPMALAATIVYALLARPGKGLGPAYLGYINIWAAGLLVAGSWLGIRLASPWLGRIPDRVHARIYIGLLVLVMLVMLAV